MMGKKHKNSFSFHLSLFNPADASGRWCFGFTDNVTDAYQHLSLTKCGDGDSLLHVNKY